MLGRKHREEQIEEMERKQALFKRVVGSEGFKVIQNTADRLERENSEPKKRDKEYKRRTKEKRKRHRRHSGDREYESKVGHDPFLIAYCHSYIELIILSFEIEKEKTIKPQPQP